MRICELEPQHEVDELEDLDCLVVRLIADCRKLRRDGPPGRHRHRRDMEVHALVLLERLAALKAAPDRLDKLAH